MNFFLFKSQNTKTNEENIRTFKFICYLMSSLGMAWGLFLASKHESFNFFGFIFYNPILVVITSIVSNLFWATFCNYMLMAISRFMSFSDAHTQNMALSDEDKNVYSKLTDASNQYKADCKNASNEEKKTLTSQYIKEIQAFSQQLSPNKTNETFKKLIASRVKKLEKEISRL